MYLSSFSHFQTSSSTAKKSKKHKKKTVSILATRRHSHKIVFPKATRTFPKIFRRLPKTFEADPNMFRSYTNKHKYSLRVKHDTSEVINIFTSEDMENMPLKWFRINFTSGVFPSKTIEVI